MSKRKYCKWIDNYVECNFEGDECPKNPSDGDSYAYKCEYILSDTIYCKICEDKAIYHAFFGESWSNMTSDSTSFSVCSFDCMSEIKDPYNCQEGMPHHTLQISEINNSKYWMMFDNEEIPLFLSILKLFITTLDTIKSSVSFDKNGYKFIVEMLERMLKE